ncbi:hypothetical protein TWF481_006019 [Arthrobotrys musiformis]|uniref:Uncharacterized protein n=1 Tax=Arthrobotrys musiformis TaxID=47236 RepID=A0AAV9WH53_9PEZI
MDVYWQYGNMAESSRAGAASSSSPSTEPPPPRCTALEIMAPDPPIMTLEDLERELAGKALSEPTKAAMSGSLNNILANVENLTTQSQILKIVAPFFPTTTEKGIAALTAFVHGIIGNWLKIKQVLTDKGVEYLMKAIDTTWQSISGIHASFWSWLSNHWEKVLETALAAVGTALGGIGGTLAGLHLVARAGAAVIGGPVGIGVALIGTALGTELGGEIGGAVRKAIINTIKN